ncbi:MAG: class I tRNA ligase family protein [Cenarchaeum sp. SB0678_bin_8]|nr:class I tRNA ligase family protein [Cenarchaeum sp. SB0678_bin_8]
MLFITPYSQDDLNFDLDDFAARINSELIGNLGNFVNRSLGFAVRTFGGIIPEPAHHDSRDEEAREEITQIAGEIDAHMALHHTDRALKRLIKFSASFNQYFQYKEPWKDREAARSCIFYSANAVHSIALALYPFMPNAAGRIWRQLGIKQEITSKSWNQLSTISIKPGHKLGDVYPLFKKVDMDDIERQKTALKEH